MKRRGPPYQMILHGLQTGYSIWKNVSPFYSILLDYIMIHHTHSIPVVNLNLNRTCPVCTGLPDNSVYRPYHMVQYVALTRLTFDRGQFSWHSPVRGLTMTTPMARSDFLQYAGLILGLFDRPHWLSPEVIIQRYIQGWLWGLIPLMDQWNICLGGGWPPPPP